jgi:hypothetical protein
MNKLSLNSASISPRSKRLSMLLIPLLCLLFSPALTGCVSKSQVVKPDPPKLNPPPAEWMVVRQPNLRQRLQQLFTESPLTATTPSGH